MELEENDRLTEMQYGFRKHRSTVNAVIRIRDIVNFINSGAYNKRKLCILVLLDVRKAFTSIRWNSAMSALEKKGISGYLQKVIGNYLSKRKLIVGNKTKNVHRGVPQESVLGPVL